MSFTCHCGMIYKHQRSLARHTKAAHTLCSGAAHSNPSAPSTPGLESSASSSLLHCNVCSRRFETKQEYADHVTSIHNLPIETETLSFESLNSFEAWKVKIEHDTTAFYKKNRGTATNKDGSRRMEFLCNRSGNYLPEGRGMRHLKIQGTKKIGGYCPSEIRLKLESDGKCSVCFVKTHWGHQQELAHISLTVDERAAIANKIAAKVPLSEILYELRRNISDPQEIERLELVTRKDLHNIRGSLNLKHQVDAASLDAWVKELQQENCVLFYKSQGSPSEEFPVLSDEDFLLAFMNNAQASMLEKYGGDIVCVGGTHGLNAYDFELVTLMVVNDLREGFPCAFLFTSRTDKDALAILFYKIRERLQTKMPRPKVFMSDMADSFYNAWAEVADSPPVKRLFCTWHVDRAWKENLNKIKSTEKKTRVYKMLRSLMEEVDEEAFAKILPVTIEKLIDDRDTRTFGEYFYDNYAQKSHLWAYCSRLRCGINTNIVESLNKCLKYYELEGKKMKRLDRSILAVMKFLQNETSDRIVALNKGKISSKLSDIRKRHKASLELNTDLVTVNDDKWSVGNGENMYTVSRNRETCSSCKLYCVECASCVHLYVCSCLDSLIFSNMCEHIHLVLRKKQETETALRGSHQPSECNDHDTRTIDVKDGRRSREKENLLSQVSCGRYNYKDQENALSCAKNDVLADLKTLSADIDASSSIEEISAIKKLINSARTIMHAVRESSAQNKRKIDPKQRQFNFDSIKKSKTSDSNSLVKPKIPHNVTTYP